MSEQFCLGVYDGLQLGDAKWLLFIPGTGQRYIVPNAVKTLLDSCRRSQSISSHVDRLLASLNLTSEERPRLTATLNDLASKGLLISLEKRMAEPQLNNEIVPKITSIGFITSDRPAALARALHSYSANLIRYGRTAEMIVMDDSSIRANRRQTIKFLGTNIAKFPVRYASQKHKHRFVVELCKLDIEPRVARFGLLGECGNNVRLFKAGANRNSILLDTLGEILLNADDDTICQPRFHPAVRDEIVLMGHDLPRDIWVYKDHDDFSRKVHWQDCDYLAQHEEILGRRISRILSEYSLEDRRVDMACHHLLRGALECDGRVLASISGIAGDSGAYDVKSLLMSPRVRQWDLSRSEAEFYRAFECREVLWVSASKTITHQSICQAASIGLFNRELLPPFCPVGRNEDGVFGALLGFAAPEGFIGHIPVAIYHRPEVGRQYPAFPDFRFADLLLALIMTVRPQHGTLLRALRGLGRELQEYTHLKDHAFWDLVLIATTRRADEKCTMLERIAGRTCAAYWRREVDLFRELTMRQVLDPVGCVPVELRKQLPLEAAKDATKMIVGQMGELLEAWPNIISATLELRKNGIRVSHDLSKTTVA